METILQTEMEEDLRVGPGTPVDQEEVVGIEVEVVQVEEGDRLGNLLHRLMIALF
jgi:hypothetical protein